MPFLKSPNMELCYGLEWILFPRKSCNYSSHKNNRNLTWNPTQAQTEPKVHNETANMEFEQVTHDSLSVKFNWEPKWFFKLFG